MSAPLNGAVPDSIDDLSTDGCPAIVSISDVHGYLKDARRALLSVGETAEFKSLVDEDVDGRLHWAGNDYVLVVNGDVIDRGPDNEASVRMVDRLASEAPPGYVRYQLGNHEMAALLPTVLNWTHWYSGRLEHAKRLAFYNRARDSLLAAAFEGYEYTYSHAGQPKTFDVREANRQLSEAADRLAEVLKSGDSMAYTESQQNIAGEYSIVLGRDGRIGKGPNAGLAWMHFEHMPPAAPQQVVVGLVGNPC